MTLPVYPGRYLLPGLTYGSKWSPDFINMPTATTASGADIDVGLAQYPLHDFELQYEFLRDGLKAEWQRGQGLEFKTMMGFFLQLGGTLGRFLYLNPSDHKVFQNQIGVGDGSTTVFTLTRTFGANGYFGTEPVGQVNLIELFNVYLNGSPSPVLPTAYAVSAAAPGANTITFTTAPGNGQKITVDMTYWYYVKFHDNTLSYENFMDRLWLLNKVSLHSCRPNA